MRLGDPLAEKFKGRYGNCPPLAGAMLHIDVTCAGLSHSNPAFAIDHVEILDAAWEDAEGRLPTHPDYDGRLMSQQTLAEVIELPTAAPVRKEQAA